MSVENENEKRYYGGVYLERHRGVAAIGYEKVPNNLASLPGVFTLKPHLFDEFRLTRRNPVGTLRKIARYIHENAPDLRAVGITSYGPFVSLDILDDKSEDPTTNRFGVIDEVTDPPLSGIDLYSTFRSAFDNFGYEANALPIDIQTDAVAGALGEADYRKTRKNELLVYILLTEGVGGGCVVDLKPVRSALHAEMGLLHVRLDEDDPLYEKNNESGIEHAGHIGDIVSLSTMTQRAKALRLSGVTRTNIANISSTRLWAAPAYYVAQLCLACTALLAPHVIIIGGPLSAAPGLIDTIRAEFRRLASHRTVMRYPPLAELDAYIQLETKFEAGVPDICVRGATVLAAQAARSNESQTGEVTNFHVT